MALDYLALVDSETQRLIEVADTARDQQVPACPDWTAFNLMFHIAYTQAHWAWLTELGDTTAPDWSQQPQLDESRDPAAVARECNVWLLRAYREAAPDARTYLWWLDDFGPNTESWRRQAHEAFMHRIDAEQAAGVSSTIDPEVAADCVAELLDNLLGSELPPAWPDSDDLLCLHLTDTGERFYVRSNGIRLVRDHSPQGPVAATVSGSAADLALAVWRRGGWQALDFDGDLDLIETFFTGTDLS